MIVSKMSAFVTQQQKNGLSSHHLWNEHKAQAPQQKYASFSGCLIDTKDRGYQMIQQAQFVGHESWNSEHPCAVPFNAQQWTSFQDLFN